MFATDRFMIRLLPGTIAGVLLALATTASAECRDDWICVDAIDAGDSVELRARNLGDYPITYTVRISGTRESYTGTPTVTRTLAPGQTEPVMRLPDSDARARRDYRIAYDWTVGDKEAKHDEAALYALPFASGRRFGVLQGYGSRFSHRGLEEFSVDFDMPEGTPVHAARAGTVVRIEAGNSRGCREPGCDKYANYIVILHGDGTTGAYYHLMKGGAVVETGDSVVQGQMIGYSGNTGHSTTPHLHFAVYRATEWGNTQSIPVRFLSADGIITRPRRGARYEAT